MTEEIARLGIAVDSRDAKKGARELDSLTGAGRRAEQQTQRLADSSKRTNQSIAGQARNSKSARREMDSLAQSQDRARRSSDGLSGSVRRLGTAVATYLSARQILQYAESWTNLENRLKTVTDTQGELNFALDATFNIAQRSRSPLESTAELYQRIQSNANELRLTGGEVAGVVETITKSLSISGASAAAADAALVQLGQAFASGTLRGEELNSVLEQAPALAKALADGLGVTVGELRTLGSEGELTADRVVAALQRQAGQIDSAFADLEPTVGQSITLINNSLTRFVGELDDVTGGSGALARAIQGLSEYLDDGALLDGIVRQMEIWSLLVDQATGGISGLKNEMQLLKDIGGGSVDFILKAFEEMPVNIKTMIQTLTTEVAYGLDYIGLLSEEFAQKVKAVFGSETFDEVEARYAEAFNGIASARRTSIESILDERTQTLANADTAVDAIRKERDERKLAYDERIQQGRSLAEQHSAGAGVGGGPSDEDLEKNLERVRQQLYTEEQEIAASFVRRQEALADYLASNGDFETEYRELTLSNVEQFNQEMLDLDQRRLDAQVRATERAERQKIAAEKQAQRVRLQAQQAYAALASSIIYAAFGESKDARRAQALISTYTATNNALATDAPWPIPQTFAAAAFLAGIKNVTAIEGVSIGGGGGVSAPSPSASIGNTSFNTPVIAQEFPVPDQRSGPTVNIYNPVGLDEEILAQKITELYDRDFIDARGAA